ncbi:iron-sulfur cluster insertion protein ErpA [Candidatus Berkiella cookevillensis]|uniref:Iron-sulfur cluster insertion protein ErpA n=1 Tax=Candidatus Berkiella cookevillensis TaxID=437022 RepID=A0A0Q9YEV4_9GAMM|nr:iron-sulfur cluster insertion protein ErpA [Candidatus Berkiella cookevillensis]MCS5709437.1 iron-sulfur cluster insertion protein ErpA [Candidatus Berkiella cookevillensis]
MSNNVHPGLSISAAALKRVEELIQDEENPALQLRVYISGGGCAGFQYGFTFDSSQQPDDVITEIPLDETQTNSIKIAVDPVSMTYLEGAEIDFVENLQGSRFKINNPNAQTTCSCGSSFSLDL